MISAEVASRLERLLGALRRSTLNGSVEWEKTGNQEYTVSVRQSSFSIGTRDDDGIDPFVFSMYNSAGNLVSLIDTSDEEYSGHIRTEIRELYTAVNTSAAHIILFLDDVLNELEDRPPF